MGIRFYCPNGHKLNVKSFLAGKRGICPHCGIKFEIPQQSVAIGKIPTAVPEAPMAESVMEPVDEPLEALQAVKSPRAASAVDVQRSPAEQPGAVPASGRAAPHPAGALPSAPRPSLPTTPFGISPDPITEAPTAVWYVRPASGGQFGPAPGDVLRQWLEQKRVGPDSLVWRDGWTDWRTAAAVFPHLAAAGPRSAATPTFATTAPIPSRPAVSTQGADDWTEAIIDTKPLHHRHRSASQQSNIILGISLAIILLGAILAFVLIRMAMLQRHDSDSFNSLPASPQTTALSLV